MRARRFFRVGSAVLVLAVLMAGVKVQAQDATAPGSSCATGFTAGNEQAHNNALYLCTTTGATQNWYPEAFYIGTSSATCDSAHAGLTRYNSGALELCNGSSWVNVGNGATLALGTTATGANPQRSGDATTGLFSPAASTVAIATAGTEALRVTATGSIGLAKTSPAASVDFSAKTDGLLLQTATAAAGAACASTLKGAIRYNSNLNNIEFCDGSNWKFFAASATTSDCTPAAFSFTDVTDQSLSTLIYSNTVTITGIDSGCVASVSGSGSPEISVNGGAWSGAASINSGDTLRVRQISSSSVSTARIATVTVGTASDDWSVTTRAGQLRIFVTSGTYNGDLGSYASAGGNTGTAAGDAICQSEAGVLGYSGTWKAILSDGSTNAKDRLTLVYPIVRASSTSTVVESADLWAASLETSLNGSATWSWTGTNSDGTKHTNTCSGWTTNSSGNGATGIGSATTGSWLSGNNFACSTAQRLHCIEQ